MLARHFICKRGDGVSLNNLTFDKAAKLYRSGKWDITDDEAQSLIGGWVYLHPMKTKPSEFGGIVMGVEPVADTALKHQDRIFFLVASRKEGRAQVWRGKAHGRAHTGGAVEATYPHERVRN